MINDKDISSLVSFSLKIGVIVGLAMGSYGCITDSSTNHYNVSSKHWVHDGMWKGHPKGHWVYHSELKR